MLLTLSVLQVIVSDKLPTTSDAVPLVGKSHFCRLVDVAVACNIPILLKLMQTRRSATANRSCASIRARYCINLSHI